jgi:hypothetical protein
MKKQWFQNGKRIIQNGKRILCDECPCGCPPFEGRSVIYVDKHAAGTGDGSSWENAYTDIQTAVNAHPKKEIQIKGYGESDCYPAGITLPECAYLHGVDTGSGDVWLDGEDSVHDGIIGNLENVRIDSVCLKNCIDYGFKQCSNLNNCYTKQVTTSYYQCNYLNNCGGDGEIIIDGCKFIDSCTSNNIQFRYCENISNCSAYYLGSGAVFGSCTHIYNCSVTESGTYGVGFGLCVDLVSCDAQNCGYCGFQNCSELVDCTESNNCLTSGGTCPEWMPCNEV